MTVEELVARFPEIPPDLRDAPELAEFAEECSALLEEARKPSPCSTGHDTANHYYLRLIGPLSIYGYGLTSREKVLGQLRELVERHRADPRGFARGLLPEKVEDREIKGPGCA